MTLGVVTREQDRAGPGWTNPSWKAAQYPSHVLLYVYRPRLRSRRCCTRCLQLLLTPVVDSRREFLGHLEVGEALRADVDDLAAARVPSPVRPVASDLEGSEASNFDLLAATH